MKKHVILTLCFVTAFSGAQPDTITFNYSKSEYHDAAIDSLKKRLKIQKEIYLSDTLIQNDFSRDRILTLNYSLEELEVKSIPIYPLKKEAVNFKCGDNLENLIDFNDDKLFQVVLIYHKGKLISILKTDNTLLNHIMEDKLQNDSFKEWFKKRHFVSSLLVMSEDSETPLKIAFSNPESFYFLILGMDGVLCEINNENKIIVHTNGYPSISINEDFNYRTRIDYIRKLGAQDFFSLEVLMETCEDIGKPFKDYRVYVNTVE